MTSIETDQKNVLCLSDNDRQAGRSYYKDLCFHICVLVNERYVNLVDGGAVNWAQKLTNNGKERSVISGVGIDRLCMLKNT
jgi:hypothetical protein